MIEDVEKPFEYHIKWKNVVTLTVIHILAFWAFTIIGTIQIKTLILEYCLFLISGLGVTAGAHRLWAHRAYKAKLPLRIFLAFANLISLQTSILEWCRDHRGHHKHTESNADPHNARRGFFFAHVGWLLIRKHPDVIRKGNDLDLADLYKDPVVMFQHRHYHWAGILMAILMPTVIPLLWKESITNSFLLCNLRLCCLYNGTWLVNSAAHLYGNRPYDRRIMPRENPLVSTIALGEGFHNYHHVFPYDYTTSEFGLRLNVTTLFINLMRHFGLAYDCRKVEPTTILSRRKRTGDLCETNCLESQ